MTKRSTGTGGGAPPSLFLEVFNLFLGLAGLILALVAPTERRLQLAVLVTAAVVAWALHFRRRLLTWSGAVMVVLGGVAVVLLVAWHDGSDETANGSDATAPTVPERCAKEPGSLDAGESDVEAEAYSRAFRVAYEEAGGKEELGCAHNFLNFTFGAGVHQNFDRGDAQGALLAIAPDKVVWSPPPVSECVETATGDVKDAFRETKYPREGPYDVVGGWVFVLGYSRAGGNLPNAIIHQDEGNRCHWVTPDFWAAYEDLGGPEGELGFPSDNVRHNDEDVEEQPFEHGCLARHGTEVVVADCGAPAPEPIEQAAPDPPTTQLAYKVTAPPDSASVSIEPGGYVEQAFVPQLPLLQSMGVIVGWDPNLTTNTDFSILIEVRDEAGELVASGNADVTPANNNKDNGVSGGGAELVPGTTYFLRATNRSPEALGYRLAAIGNEGNRAEPGLCAWLVTKAGTDGELATGSNCALAGFVDVADR